MQTSQVRAFDSAELLRSLPILLCALLASVAGVDALLIWQPAILPSLTSAWLQLAPSAGRGAQAVQVFPASLAVLCVVSASALLATLARMMRAWPHATLGPAWVALSIAGFCPLQLNLPLALSGALFAALSALLMVGAGVVIRLGSRLAVSAGAMLALLPVAVLATGYATASDSQHAFGGGAVQYLAGLVASALGVVLIARLPLREANARDVPGLEGVDVVEELFAQVERAERSEARVAELEAQLRAATLAQPQVAQLRRVR